MTRRFAAPFQAAPQQILIDTGAYFALSDTTDANHERANGIRQRLLAEHWQLFTTNFIVAETHALMLTRLGYRFALRFLNDIEQSSTRIVRATPNDEQRARAIIRQYDDKRFSHTDAVSFAVMERLGIPQAFAFDRNFGQYGLQVLTPQP